MKYFADIMCCMILCYNLLGTEFFEEVFTKLYFTDIICCMALKDVV